ncbi:NUMOD4 domain-containing protein [Bacillus sp. FSL R12-0074]|uniref:NUMOD4 domain-containing protein n=1 Tax=Bacillus sp. FSL R12-0074 TaxID=2954664 RepID=UPI0030F771C4
MKEEWRDIEGYEGFEGMYQVSNLGRVRSMKREFIRSNGRVYNREGVILKPMVNHKGYLIVDLRNRGKRKGGFVHRLVAKAFIPNIECKPQVNHINGNKQDNNVNNLEWCTNGENALHAYRTGLNKPNSNGGRPKRKINQISNDGEIVATFISLSEAIDKTKINNISAVCRGVRPRAGGFIWKFADEEVVV